jgi:hypothetical protein
LPGKRAEQVGGEWAGAGGVADGGAEQSRHEDPVGFTTAAHRQPLGTFDGRELRLGEARAAKIDERTIKAAAFFAKENS